MRFAETLLASGEIDQSNLRSAKQTDVFILRGTEPDEIYEPSFTYHGFRYVQVTGLEAQPTADTLLGIVIHSDLEFTANLNSYNPTIDRIWNNTRWTQRSNFLGIPTDCPQRDERQGWMGDAGFFWDAAAFCMDVAAFTRRQMKNVSDAQLSNGVYPMLAPTPSAQSEVLNHGEALPGFADAGIILPWTAWRRYGDDSIIEEHWQGMHAYVNSISKYNPDYIWRNRRNGLGDWLAVDEKSDDDPTTPYDLTSTAYWAYSVALLTEMADAIGLQREATSLRAVLKRISTAFSQCFVRADGYIGNGSQTSYVLALKFGLVPEHIRGLASRRLVADIRRRGNALSTGFVGTRFLLDALVDTGYASVAYDLLFKTTYPSWGYMIANGATTMWESWNGRVWSGTDVGASMPNSYNHFALGSVCGFLFRRVAGIDAHSPGFSTVVVNPIADSRLTEGGGEYNSIRGRICTHWKLRQDKSFSLALTLPANTTGIVHIPGGRGARIYESRRNISRRGDFDILRENDRETVVQLGSGSYSIEAVPSVSVR